jgi:hypothetical protein
MTPLWKEPEREQIDSDRGGSTLVYLVLAMVMGVLPGIQLSNTPPGPGVNPLTPAEQSRAVYVASGCSYATHSRCAR